MSITIHLPVQISEQAWEDLIVGSGFDTLSWWRNIDYRSPAPPPKRKSRSAPARSARRTPTSTGCAPTTGCGTEHCQRMCGSVTPISH